MGHRSNHTLVTLPKEDTYKHDVELFPDHPLPVVALTRDKGSHSTLFSTKNDFPLYPLHEIGISERKTAHDTPFRSLLL